MEEQFKLDLSHKNTEILKITKLAAKQLNDRRKSKKKIKHKEIKLSNKDIEKLDEKFNNIISSLSVKNNKEYTKVNYWETKEIKDNNDTIEINEKKPDDFIEYEKMLQKVYNMLGKNFVGISEKIIISRPQVVKDGTNKVRIENFNSICNELNRPKLHLLNFIASETGSTASLNEREMLILNGKFSNSDIEKILYKYIVEFVKCNMCSNINTEIIKDKEHKINIIKCNKCACERSIKL